MRGKAQGQGRYEHPDGDVYIGGWHEELRTKTAKLSPEPAEPHKGLSDLSPEDQAHGSGLYIHTDGSRYEAPAPA